MKRFTLLLAVASFIFTVGCKGDRTTIINTGPDNAPVAHDQTVPVGPEKSTITLSATPAVGNAVTLFRVNQPLHGVLEITSEIWVHEGKAQVQVSYLADPGYEGADSFTFWVYDNRGNESKLATVTLQVSRNKHGPGSPPTAVASWRAVNRTVFFDASTSMGGTANADGRKFELSELKFWWDTDNDGKVNHDWSSSPNAEQPYSADGKYHVKLRVMNPDGKVHSVVFEVEVRDGSSSGGGRVKKGDPGSGTWQWTRQAGVYGYNDGVASVMLPNGRVLTAGNARGKISFGEGVRTKWLHGPTPFDREPGWLAMALYNKDATLEDLWTVNNEIKARHVAYDLVRTPGGYILTGGFRGSITAGKTTLRSSGNLDMFLIAYDLKHEVIWATSVKGSAPAGEYDVIHDLAVDAKGFVWICGTHRRTAEFDQSVKLTSQTAGYFVARYHSAGHLDWAKSLTDNARWLATTNEGCLVSGKELQHYAANGGALWKEPLTGGPVTWFPQDGGFAVVHPDGPRDNDLVRYKSDKSASWTEPLGMGQFSIDRYSDTSLVLAGRLTLQQLDPNGEVKWSKPAYQGSLCVTENGSVLLTGNLFERTVVDNRDNIRRPRSNSRKGQDLIVTVWN